MTLTAYTDGASRGNPGESGVGLLIKDQHGNVVLSRSGYIGKATNNIAEYSALIELLKRARTLNCSKLIAHSDSELMVRQVNGEYKVRNGEIRKYIRRVHQLLHSLPFEFELRYVTRDENSEADRLANIGIDSRRKIPD